MVAVEDVIERDGIVKQKNKRSGFSGKKKIKIYNAREARKVVRKNGWKLMRVNGSHYIYKHPDSDKILTISKDLNRIVWERCVDEYNLDLSL